MPKTQTIIVQQHINAPAKPALKASCNGCGLCCLTEPCPMARLWLWQGRGSCRALYWQQTQQRYVCGLVLMPDVYIRCLPKRWRVWAGRFFASRIGSGIGCDFDAEAS